MPGPSDGQTPRSSIPSPSKSIIAPAPMNGESSKDSNASHHHRSFKTYVDEGNGDLSIVERGKENNNLANGAVYDTTKRRPRSSGGFLLESAFSGAQDGQQGSTFHETTLDKGKAVAHITSGSIKDKTYGLLKRRPKQFTSRSPLAKEVTDEASERAAIAPHGRNHHEPSTSSKGVRTDDSLVSGYHVAVASSSAFDKSSLSSANTLGNSSIDTDPARIVNLALDLSESRRRNISAGWLSPVDLHSSRRATSAGQPSPVPVYGVTGGSLKHHLQQQRQTSRNISPRSDRFVRQGARSPSHKVRQDVQGHLQTPVTPSYDLTLVDDLNFNPSNATLARAERARLFFELSYENRRLLQYLPRIPVPSTSRPATAKSQAKKIGLNEQDTGRHYNPLQYIRNRRTRARGRKTFDAEADGWNDVDRVRSWVDAVARDRDSGNHPVRYQLQLPSFLPIGDGQETAIGQSPKSTTSQTVEQKHGRPPRPRIDWITTPWDLLADAHWLDKEDNIRLIEDRDGNKLFLGLRSPETTTGRSSRDLAPSDGRRSESLVRSTSSPEKGEREVFKQQDGSIKARGRKRHQSRGSVTSLRGFGSSQDRKGLWQRKMMRSRSSSLSDDSARDSIGSVRGYLGTGNDRERQDSAVLEKQMLDMLRKEAENQGSDTSLVEVDGSFDSDYNEGPSINEQKVNGNARQGSKIRKPKRRTGSLVADVKIRPSKSSFEEERGRQPRMSFAGVGRTTASSSRAAEFVPSIAINPTPPASRSKSPKKSLKSPPKTFIANYSKERQSISATDFADDISRNQSQQEQKRLEDHLPSTDPVTSPSDGFLSPKSAESFRNIRHRHSNSKEDRDSDSRFRMFKGGRIAELVGNEMSRVSDMLWRRESTIRASAPTSPIASDDSDSDESTFLDKMKRGSSNALSRMTTESDGGKLSRRSTNADQPKYYMSNLPSFTSPIKKDSLESTTRSTAGDPMSRQQAAFRKRGRSKRFDLLSPLRMDTKSAASSPASPTTPERPRHEDQDISHSIESSPDISAKGRSRGEDPIFPNLSLPGPPKKLHYPITGLTALDVHRAKSGDRRPTLQDKRHWSISDRGVSQVRGTVDHKDIIRVRALLLSSGVKANEIARRANEIRDVSYPILQELERNAMMSLRKVPLRQEHVLASRIIVKNIQDANVQLREDAEIVSQSAIGSLHEQIKAVDDKITSKLTPLGRASADDADALLTELASSHVLNVKRLNDSIDAALRRRRRRFRWFRRGGYVLLEWMVLGLMWWIWFIVVLIRLATALVWVVYRGTTWLFWL